MEARELRIGNWVTGVFVDPMQIKLLSQLESFSETYNPIPITEKWLTDLGFKNNSGDHWEKQWRPGDRTFKVYFVAEYLGLVGASFPHKNIQYVHELQNLYFALTGEELNYDSN